MLPTHIGAHPPSRLKDATRGERKVRVCVRVRVCIGVGVLNTDFRVYYNTKVHIII